MNQHMMKTLYLIRGLPGSGKSTLAKQILLATGGNLSNHLEADMYFETKNGYEFDVEKLPQAHSWCQSMTEHKMRRQESTVVVSNTFTTLDEMRPYKLMAERNGYVLFILTTENAFQNVHGVPDSKLQAMYDRFERIPY